MFDKIKGESTLCFASLRGTEECAGKEAGSGAKLFGFKCWFGYLLTMNLKNLLQLFL